MTPSAASSISAPLRSRAGAAPPVWVAAFVALLAVALFSPSLGYDFIYDDHVQIQANPWLQSPDGFHQLFTQPFWGFFRDRGDAATNYYRPLYGTIYALTARAFGVAPLPFHAVSLLLHGLVAFLVVLLVGRLRAPGDAESREGTGPLWVAGLLFALHPAHAETVAWVGGQADLLAALGALVALWFYLESREPGIPAGRRRASLVLAPLAFLGAALAKETGLAFLALPLAVELTERNLAPLAPEAAPKTRGRGAASRLAGFGLAAFVYLALRLHALGALAPRRYGVTPSGGGAGTYALALFGRYLAFLLVPFPAQVLAQVPHRTPTDPDVLGGLGVLLLQAALALVLLRRGRGPRSLVVPLAFLTAFLLPVLFADAIGGSNFAERYLYLPSIGLAWLGAEGWRRLSRTPSRPWRIAGCAALGLMGLVGLGAAASARARLFRDDLSLFSAAVRSSPGSYIARNNLGMALFGEGRLDEAERQYREALQLSPRSVAARSNLGLIAERRGDLEGARRLYLEALALSPRHALAALRLARLARTRGDQTEAAQTLDRLFAAGGESYEALCLRAELWLEGGEPARAVPLLRRALADFPDRPRARRLLAEAEAKGVAG